MRRSLAAWMTLALVSTAWWSGCAGRPRDSTPTHEATTSPALAETHEAPERPVVETATPVGKKATISPAPTSPAEEEIVTPDDTVRPGTQQIVRFAKEDLARRFDIPAEEITVVLVEPVEWRDTSLGCPRPGMIYAQVITPGFRVMLEAEAKTYEYHTDRSSVVVLCEVSGGSGSKGTDATVDDGWPSQPRDEGEVDTSRITPIPPPR